MLDASKASALWVVGEYGVVNCNCPIVQAAAPDILRIFAGRFTDENVEVKQQVLNLAVKLFLLGDKKDSRVERLCHLVLELARYDLDYDLRDRSRYATAMLGLAPLQSEGGIDESALQGLRRQADSILLGEKMPPLTLLGPVAMQGMTDLTIGSLSSMMQHETTNYMPLPIWPDVQPEPSVRDLQMEKPEGGGVLADVGDENNPAFYSSGSDSSSSSSSSDDDSEESDESDSESGSSEEQSEEESESGSESSEESESDIGEESNAESHDDSDEASSYDESSSEYDDDDDEDSTAAAEKMAAATTSFTGFGSYGSSVATAAPGGGMDGGGPMPMDPFAGMADLLPPAGSPSPLMQPLQPQVAGAAWPPLQQQQMAAPISDVAGLMMGLTMNPSTPDPGLASPGLAPGFASPMQNSNLMMRPTLESGVSLSFPPRVLLRQEMVCGLQVEYQFPRGASSTPTQGRLTIHLILRNCRDGPIKRIRVTPKDISVKFTGPAEFPLLPSQESVTAVFNVDAAQRDVRLEIRTERGIYPATFNVPQEELICPMVLDIAGFDAASKSLGTFNMAKSSVSFPNDTAVEEVPRRICETINVAQVTESDWEISGKGMWAGVLHTGVNQERVLVMVTLDQAKTTGSLSLFCDNAMLTATLSNVLKKAIQR
mmetsp:Transcript_49205/g.67077  ORF Transcript_49205/g.67077 Transcript_49205/m.67077 type:complete len:657 (+) Transcript_49205:35-2005(+)